MNTAFPPFRLLAAAGMLLLTCSHTSAQTIYIGAAAGDWDLPANWSTGAMPGNADNVVIDNRAQNSTVTIGPNRTRSALTLDIRTGDAVVLSNNSLLFLAGSAFALDGEFRVQAAGNATDLRMDAVETFLSGSGSIVLGGTSNNSRLYGAGSLLNGATIEGRGQLGVNLLFITNVTGGLIDANVSAAANPGAVLVIDPRSAGGLMNQGTIQASAGGILQLSGNGGGIFENDSGLIQALGAGSEVQFFDGSLVEGGTLHTAEGGLLHGMANQNYFFSSVTFDAGTQIIGENNSDFGVLGAITNDGTITINGGANDTDVELQGDTAFLGSGELVLSGSNNARIHALSGTQFLINGEEHTIRGRGQIGVNVTGVVNNGTITAGVTGAALVLDPSNALGFQNNALLQATGGGILLLSGNGGGTFDNTGGLIQALGAGSEVHFTNSSSVNGGILHTEGGGLLRGLANQNYFFTDVTFDAGTQVTGENNSDLGVLGSITNNGTITINAAGNDTDVELQGDTAFTGSGELVLAGSNNARIHALSGMQTLTNGSDHTIRGRGQIGVNVTGVVNNGTITANVTGTALVLDPSSALGFDNNATLQAAGGGVLALSGNGGGGFDNSEGLILALGAGSEVQFTSSSSVNGGILHTEGGGLLHGLANQNFFFTDVTFDAGTQVTGENNSDFGVLGSITNDGTITINAGANDTDVELQGDTAFTGSGELVLTGSNNARIHALSGTQTLTNGSEHSIRGRGQIGVNVTGVVNDGTIAADAAGAALVLDPSSALGFDNNATLQAAGGGVLGLSGNGGGAFNNSGGLIQALGAGSEVQFFNSSSVVGGTLHTEDGGLLHGMANQNYFFTSVTFDAGTQVTAENNSDFGVLGSIINDGFIMMNAGVNDTDIELQGDTAFLGTGEIVLNSSNPGANNARIHGIAGTHTLTNGSGHTMRGRGQIGVNTVNVFNAAGAVMDADVNGAGLLLDPANGFGTFDNRGVLSASNGGILQLTGSGGGTFDNTGGVIRANDGSTVHLLSGTSIEGGSFESDGSGVILIPDNHTATISDAVLSGSMAMANNTSLTLSGQIVHRGDLAITAGGNATDLIVDSILNLQGGGTISMLSNNARLRGAGVFVNQDHLIQGAGQIGVNQSAGTNAAGAVIHALTAGGTMTIDPNAFLGFVNDGILRASSGGSLHLSGNAGGQFTNGDTGVIEALDGGTVSHGSSAFLTNLRDGKLAGGTYRVIDGGNGASLSLPGGNITANAADIELSGAGAQFAQLASLATNEGSLSVANGASLQTTGDLTLTGSSSLDVDIAGKPNDTGLWGRIVAAGKSVLGGVLNVSVNIGNTFAAALGDVWKIISGSIREGVFADVNITTGDLPAGSRIEVEYVADGVQVAVVPAVAALLAAPTYQSWAAALDPDVDSDPSADSDGDGATNLEEYAFGMDPSQPDPWRTPVPHIDRASGQSFAALTYSFPSGVDYPSDVVYTVERSNDLRSWTSAGISAGDHEILDGTGRESTTFRCEDAMDGTAAPVFLRVSVHLQDQVAEAK